MSINAQDDGTIHIEADHVDTMVLALCCLQTLWENHPDTVRGIARAMGDPGLVAHGPRGKELLDLLLRKGR